MFEMILIASGSFLAAMFCVWIYRIAKSMHEAKFRHVRLVGRGRTTNIARGSGTVQLKSINPRAGMTSAANGNRKPWGW